MTEQNEVLADWEGADDLEQDLQDKIKKTMEPQEPKIEKGDRQIIDVMVKEIADIARSNFEKIVSGELDSEGAKTRILNEVEDALDKKFD